MLYSRSCLHTEHYMEHFKSKKTITSFEINFSPRDIWNFLPALRICFSINHLYFQNKSWKCCIVGYEYKQRPCQSKFYVTLPAYSLTKIHKNRHYTNTSFTQKQITQELCIKYSLYRQLQSQYTNWFPANQLRKYFYYCMHHIVLCHNIFKTTLILITCK